MCGMMFQDLRAIAELECKMPVVVCVIGVPGYWGDRQRHAIRDAATMAGFKVLRILKLIKCTSHVERAHDRRIRCEFQRVRSVGTLRITIGLVLIAVLLAM